MKNLIGGSDFDTYYVSNSGTINDAYFNGLIMFIDKSLQVMNIQRALYIERVFT